MPTPPKRLLTQAEAAAQLGMAPDTLRLWRHLGQGPPFVKVGRSVRYAQADLDRWVAQRTVDPARAS